MAIVMDELSVLFLLKAFAWAFVPVSTLVPPSDLLVPSTNKNNSTPSYASSTISSFILSNTILGLVSWLPAASPYSF